MMTNTNKCLKVLHVITCLHTGGAEMMLYKILSGMNRKRFKPLVISLIDGGPVKEKIERLNIQVYSLGMRHGIPTPAAIWRLQNLVRKFQPDLIQGWMYHGNIAAWLGRKMYGGHLPLYWNVRHSFYGIRYEKRLTRILIRWGSYLSAHVKTVIYNSTVSRYQHEAIGYNSTHSVVIPNGFDTNVFHPDTKARFSVRQELGVDNSTCLIGLIGRYHPMKDHENFFNAVKIVLKNNVDTQFLLAGRGIDSKNKILLAQIKSHGLENFLFLLGERADMPRLTAALDIACSSSSYGEGFPNVIGEAMACGVPCVVTDVGDSALVVDDTGRVVPARNSETFAKGIIQLQGLPECERKALCKSAQRRIEENFTLDKIVQDYETLYGK